jgi:hypothetical protein
MLLELVQSFWIDVHCHNHGAESIGDLYAKASHGPYSDENRHVSSRETTAPNCLISRRDHTGDSQVRDLDTPRINTGVFEIRDRAQALGRQANVSAKTTVDVVADKNLVRAHEASSGPTHITFATRDDARRHHRLAMK